MIPRTDTYVDTQEQEYDNEANQMTWQQHLKTMIRDPNELLNELELDASWLKGAQIGHSEFEVRVPRPYLQRIRVGDPEDPLLKQVLPMAAEGQKQVTGYSYDPLGEESATQSAGIIQKYHGRVLLMIAGSCAVNCRYCFRRHFPYGDHNLSSEEWQDALSQIARDSSIEEVILSGGDPLMLTDKRLKSLVDSLAAIPHLKRLRVHSRLPIVIPSRITHELASILSSSRLQSVMVIHANHPNEFDMQVDMALSTLRQFGIILLNQSVLLAGINDDVDVLCALSERMFQAGVLPYYLHLLDPVIGTAHFEVTDRKGKKLVGDMLAKMPGYLVPKLVREIAGQASKTPVAPIQP